MDKMDTTSDVQVPELELSDDSQNEVHLFEDVLSLLDPKQRSVYYIDDLDDAIVDGKFIAKEGDLLVVEKWSTLNPKRHWMGTSIYKIRMIDVLNDSGTLYLHDEELSQAAMANWKTGPSHGWRFKIAPKNFTLSGRDKPDFAPKAAAKPVILDEKGEVVKRKPGRPKGVKNKPNPERDAARAAHEALRASRKLARAERREQRAKDDAARAERKAAREASKQDN